MAYYFIFPEIDSTMYSHPDRKEMNSGADELLEIVKEPGDSDQNHYPSRVLIKFKNEDIKEAISIVGDENFTSSLSSSVNLQLSIAQAKNITETHVLNAYAVSQSWNEGTGRYLNNPTSSNGCSWRFRDNSITATEWATSSFGTGGGTGSISSSVLTPGGGTWYTGSNFFGTQQFLKGDSLDTDINVTEIIHKFSASINAGQTYPQGIDNHGFLIKTLDSVESNASSSFGELQYFSTDTHTIYPPKLCFKWYDVINQTGQYDSNLVVSVSSSLYVSIYNNKEEYNQNDIAIFRINVRDKYPTREFTTTSNYLKNQRLKTAFSTYSIRDAHTEREIMPFHDTYTQISNDSISSFFKIYMKGLQPERYYRILLKIKDSNLKDAETKVFDDNYIFKVIR